MSSKDNPAGRKGTGGRGVPTWAWWVAAVVAVAVIGGVIVLGGPNPAASDHGSGNMILPTYVTSQKAAVAYRFAVEKPDVLKYMPCYCGCEKDGHKSNLDCFVKEVKANGAVVYDPMGAG